MIGSPNIYYTNSLSSDFKKFKFSIGEKPTTLPLTAVYPNAHWRIQTWSESKNIMTTKNYCTYIYITS